MTDHTKPKFDKGELHRRPEFAEESKSAIISNASSNSSNTSRPPAPVSFQTTRESSAVGGGKTLSTHERTSNARPATNVANNNIASSGSNISAQTACNVPNRNPKAPPPRQHQQLHHEPQQPDRRVSFYEAPTDPAPRNAVNKTEPEDSFCFADDDEFFAAFDAEECDLGRPVETEADTGQPIAHEESYSATDEDNSTTAINLSSANNTAQTDRAARLQRLQQQIAKYSGKNTFTTSPPLQESSPKEQTHTSNASSSHQVANNSRSTPLRLPNGMNNLNHAQQQRNNRPPAPLTSNLNQQNQNENSSSPLSSGSRESGGKRTLPPSIGGFHFPPGVVRLLSFNQLLV